MATVIRFARHGSKKKPFFRIVVQDARFPRDGRFIERLGVYDPIKKESSLNVSRDRLEYWLSTGAQLSTSVRNRLRVKMREWKTGGGVEPAPTPPVKAKAKPKETSKEA